MEKQRESIIIKRKGDFPAKNDEVDPEIGDYLLFSSFVKQTVQRNIFKREQFEAGRLKNFVYAWERITSDPVVLNDVSGFKIPFTYMPIQHNYL